MINLDAIGITKTEDLQRYVVQIRCPICKKIHNVEIKTSELFLLRQTGDVSGVLKNYPDVVREQLISGMCPECQADFFGMSENEEE